ncbi:ethylmalonyl-CoA decarboxylase [Microcaecilia unicolor]|uniref:Ethylmalonyl-CoA decarboxylase n=1 Tax=Microcaecilia unicolor TaxID=1415580 RepID=A0A6P7XPW4_9AMPH|nr:ethylmalonyl-CoA decarboxylase-like [Microcaecilia unicolor]
MKTKLPHQCTAPIHSAIQRFQENGIKERYQRYSGGSVDLSKGEDGIAVLTLNNPARMNALTGTMGLELDDRLNELEEWTAGKGLIVRGANNTFCSGTDLNSITVMRSSEDGLEFVTHTQRMTTRLKRLPFISVALVQGKALGAGAELITACDFRLMTPGSEICFLHKQVGIVPGWGGGARLVQIVGGQQSLKLLSGALRMDPVKALNAGLIDDILPPDEDRALEEAHHWLSQYTNAPAEIIQGLKKVISAGRELSIEEALKIERNIFGTMWSSPVSLQALAQAIKRK